MEHVWANFAASQVYRSDDWTMLKTSLHWLAAAMFGGLGVRNPASLLDNAPLRELLTQNVRFDGIRALDRARASRRRRGHGVGVCDGALRDVLPRPPRARRRGHACGASAARRGSTSTT